MTPRKIKYIDGGSPEYWRQRTEGFRLIREAERAHERVKRAPMYISGGYDEDGDVIPVEPGFLNYVNREPLGVVGQIVPWNFPLMFCSWKMGPALAAGNTVVLKPSELTPLSSLRLAELMVDVGFPPGVVNVVPGYGHTAGE